MDNYFSIARELRAPTGMDHMIYLEEREDSLNQNFKAQVMVRPAQYSTPTVSLDIVDPSASLAQLASTKMVTHLVHACRAKTSLLWRTIQRLARNLLNVNIDVICISKILRRIRIA